MYVYIITYIYIYINQNKSFTSIVSQAYFERTTHLGTSFSGACWTKSWANALVASSRLTGERSISPSSRSFLAIGWINRWIPSGND